MKADTTSITEEEHRGTKRLKMRGNYGRFTIVENGTVDVRTDGVLIGYFNGLSIYDFIMRFYNDLDKEAQDEAINFIWEHKDQMFNGEPKPHTLKGDSQGYRINADDTRMLEEDILTDLKIDPKVVKEDVQEEFAEETARDIAYDIDPHDILLEIAEEMAQEIKEEVEDIETKVEFQRICERDWWDDAHHYFRERKSEHIYEEYNKQDLKYEFEEWLLEEVMADELIIWDIYYEYDDDEWKLKHTEADRSKRTAQVKRKIKTNDITDGDGPAILRMRKMNGDVEDRVYVGDAQYFSLMNDEDRRKAYKCAGVDHECEVDISPEHDEDQTTFADFEG